MSKLKLMYDVITVMKEKEVIGGTFQAEVKKDQIRVASFTNEFEKNLANGETKLKITTEMDSDGKKVRHESQTEFAIQGCSEHRHHGFMKHMSHHHPHHNFQDQNEIRSGGIKGKLNKLAFVLSIFNQIKVVEQEDNSVRLSLSLAEIPDDLKKVLLERVSQRRSEQHQSHHHCFMKELSTLTDPKIEVNLLIKPSREVEKFSITVNGKQSDELNETHDLNLAAELRLN